MSDVFRQPPPQLNLGRWAYTVNQMSLIQETGFSLPQHLAEGWFIIVLKRFITFHLWAAILISILSADLAEPQKNSLSVVGALSGETDKGFARAFEPMTLQFPHDHGPHPGYKIEWWYYTGNLRTDSGQDFDTPRYARAEPAPIHRISSATQSKDFGYQLTFFRFALTPQMPERISNLATNQIYMAHFALTDAAHSQYFCFERFSRGAGGLAGATGEPTYEVWLENWSAKEVEPGVVRLQAVDDQMEPQTAIDLTLRETHPPILHGNRGLSQKGPEPGNANYYYSLVQLETIGDITSNGKTMTVSGLSWMDHEFGTSALAERVVGWDWFSLQLENGAALMLYCLRQSDQSYAPHTFEGTLVYPDGRQLRIGMADFTLTPRGKWTSPKSGAAYPSGWHVVFPELNIDLQIEPLIPNQEFHISFTYWEGAVRVSGQMDSVTVSGRGYAELTGYSDSSGQYLR